MYKYNLSNISIASIRRGRSLKTLMKNIEFLEEVGGDTEEEEMELYAGIARQCAEAGYTYDEIVNMVYPQLDDDCPDGDWEEWAEEEYEAWLENRHEFNEDELPF